MAAQPQREWFEKDYYKVLGVPESATDKEIQRAYRKLAKQYHPDANPGSEERFKEVSAAHDVLGDVDKRKEYDEVRKLGPMAGAFGGAGEAGRGGGRGRRRAGPAVSRQGCRASSAAGEGPHPRRRRGGTAHPAVQARRARAQQRAAGRPVRRRARRQAPVVRTQGPQP